MRGEANQNEISSLIIPNRLLSYIHKAERQKENEIAKKFNSYIPEIDGKEVTKTEIFKILQTETNPEVRKKAYDAKIKGGDLIACEMVDFVRMRNSFAKNKGYKNFFEYKLKQR